MFVYGEKSSRELATCHNQLQYVFKEVLRFADHSIVKGHRNKEAQNLAFDQGFSKIKWPDGNHNSRPSTALDAKPYPLSNDRIESMRQLQYFGGIVLGVAFVHGITLRWGGDWNRNHDLSDQSFNDLYHFELVNPFPPLR